MTFKIVPIVEGHGEVKALSILLRRLCYWLTPDSYTDVGSPIRVRRARFLTKTRSFGGISSLLRPRSKTAVGYSSCSMPMMTARQSLGQKSSIVLVASCHIVEYRLYCRNVSMKLGFLASAGSLDGKAWIRAEWACHPRSGDTPESQRLAESTHAERYI